jgi:hypothetical protein
VERCRECGRLTEARPYDDDQCPACGGELEELRIPIRREPPPPPTSGEELSDRLLGIGA